MARGKGLKSLMRWKKCQRRVANAVLRAVRMGKSNGAKRAELKAKANALASVACSKGVKKGRVGKKRRAGRGTRSSSRSTFNPPDFARHLPYKQPEPPFNPEVF